MHQAIARRLSAGTIVRLAALELVAQQLAEQVVVAIPLAPPVERHHEAVRALERLERARRPRRLEHGVAQTAAHAIQHRGVLEELRLGRRQPGQELEAEVLGHEPVVAGEARGARRARRPGLQRQRREVQAGRPALRPLGQLGELARVELDAGRLQQQLGLPLVEPEVGHADLVHQPLRPPAGERQRRLFPARDRDLRAGRNVLAPARRARRDRTDWRRRADRRARAPTGARVQPARSRGAGRASTRSIPPGPDNASNTSGAERLDAVNRGGDVPQEHDGVVVARRRARPTRTDADQPRPTARAASSCRTRRARPRSREATLDAHSRAITAALRHGAGPGRRRRQLRLDEVEWEFRHGHRLADAKAGGRVGQPARAVSAEVTFR